MIWREVEFESLYGLHREVISWTKNIGSCTGSTLTLVIEVAFLLMCHLSFGTSQNSKTSYSLATLELYPKGKRIAGNISGFLFGTSHLEHRNMHLNLPISTPYGKTSSDGSPNLKIKADPWMKYLEAVARSSFNSLLAHKLSRWQYDSSYQCITFVIHFKPQFWWWSSFEHACVGACCTFTLFHAHQRQIMKSWLLQGCPRESFFPIFFDHSCFENRDQMHLRMAFFRIWDAPPRNSDNQDLPFLAFGPSGISPPQKKNYKPTSLHYCCWWKKSCIIWDV